MSGYYAYLTAFVLPQRDGAEAWSNNAYLDALFLSDHRHRGNNSTSTSTRGQ
jgi:hypothetical protein